MSPESDSPPSPLYSNVDQESVSSTPQNGVPKKEGFAPSEPIQAEKETQQSTEKLIEKRDEVTEDDLAQQGPQKPEEKEAESIEIKEENPSDSNPLAAPSSPPKDASTFDDLYKRYLTKNPSNITSPEIGFEEPQEGNPNLPSSPPKFHSLESSEKIPSAQDNGIHPAEAKQLTEESEKGLQESSPGKQSPQESDIFQQLEDVLADPDDDEETAQLKRKLLAKIRLRRTNSSQMEPPNPSKAQESPPSQVVEKTIRHTRVETGPSPKISDPPKPRRESDESFFRERSFSFSSFDLSTRLHFSSSSFFLPFLFFDFSNLRWKTKQNKTKQNKQNKTKQNKTKQNKQTNKKQKT